MRFSKKWWGWRVVKSCEESTATLHHHKHLTHNSLHHNREEWRVKTRVGFLQAKTTFPTARMLRENGSGRQVEIFLPSVSFVPDCGTIFALYWGNFLPLPGTKWYVGRNFSVYPSIFPTSNCWKMIFNYAFSHFTLHSSQIRLKPR